MTKTKSILSVAAIGVIGLILGYLFQAWLRDRLIMSAGFYNFQAMGTEVEITVNPVRYKRFPGAIDAVSSTIAAGVAQIVAVERDMSVFQQDSVVAKINSAAGSDEKFLLTKPAQEIFALASSVNEASDGLFDPTVGPYMKVWGFRGGDPLKAPPSATEISEAGALCGWTNVVEFTGREARLRVAGSALDFGAVAKGSGVDAAFREMFRMGCRDFMVNVGGNIRCTGLPKRGGEGWKIAVRNPFYSQGEASLGTLTLTGEYAVATSGQYERYVEIDGVRYAHIINPQTGYPAECDGLVQVTVVAGTAGIADALSTALFLAGSDAGMELIKKFEGAEAMFVSGTKESPVVRMTPGFGKYYKSNENNF